MKKILAIFSVPVFAALVLVLASCGTSTRVVSSWQSPTASATHADKIMVLAMMADRQAKDHIELTLARSLAARGITTATGTSEFGPRGFGNLTQDEINAKLEREGFDAIMIVCLTARDKDVDYVPGTPYISPYGSAYYGYYGRYRYMYDTVYTPGYYTTSTTYVLDADLYTIPDDALVYSAQTRSYDPAGSRDLAESFSQEIVEDLVQKRII